MPDAIPSCQGPHPEPGTPWLKAPPGAVDTHFHVFGPTTRYPYTPARSYTPPEAPLSRYRGLLGRLGIDRAVIVHPSVHGTDNRVTLDALAASGDWMRGVAVVDETVSEAALREMHDHGVRGLRINVLFKGGVGFDAARRLADRIKDLGWHLQFLIDVSQTPGFARELAALPVDSVVDHMGHMSTAKGVDHPAFQDLLALLREGRTWVKLSGAYRITQEREAPYGDVMPFAQALVAANPDRMLWATDWPHPAVTIPMPDDAALLDMLGDWVPEAATRRKILVDNPARLYGFDDPNDAP